MLATDLKNLALDTVRIDGGTQQRPLDEQAVAEYAQLVLDGSEPPAVEAVYDGKDHWLWDGFHRYHAKRKAGHSKISVNVRTGTQREAVWLSFGANQDHGVRRQAGAVREIVERILADAEWAKRPQADIARHVGVTPQYVSKVKLSINQLIDAPETRTVTRGGKTFEMSTAAIGKTNGENRHSHVPTRTYGATPTEDSGPRESRRDREPVDDEPAPHKANGKHPAEPKSAATWEWSKAIQTVFEQISIVKKRGGINALLDAWDNDTAADYLRTLRHVREVCDEYIPPLEEHLSCLQRKR